MIGVKRSAVVALGLLLVGAALIPRPRVVLADSGSEGYTNISPKEARALIGAQAGNPDFVILDVRTPGEFLAGHLPGAVLVDYYSKTFREEIARLPRAKTYLVYCRTGNRSGSALGLMKELGFRQVYHLAGGITKWAEEGLATAK